MGGRGGASHRGTTAHGGRAIDNLTSITQINDWIKKQHWFRAGSLVSLKGVDVNAAKGIARAFEQVFDKYPQLKGQFSGVKSFNLGNGTYADCNLATGQIRVSNAMYGNVRDLERHYERDIRSNWHPVGTDWSAIVTHEIGHAIDGYISQRLRDRDISYYDWSKNSDDLLRKVAGKLNLGTTSADIAREVSRYGATQSVEWFAEAFAEGMRSEHPRRMAKEFMLELDEILRRLR